MYNENYFIDRVESLYRDFDHSLRTIGSERLGSQDIFFRLSRFANPTLEYSEIKRICNDLDKVSLDPNEPSGHKRWPVAWKYAANRYKAIAEKAEAENFKVTAGNNFLRASLLAHAGQMMCRPEWYEKIELQMIRASSYRRAALHLGLEEHKIPYRDHFLPGYLWIPKGVDKPPLVIMAPGADSTKEECHRWAESFVARGMATFTFDGPGQGELTPLINRSLPMRLETYHEVFSAILDHFERKDKERLNLNRTAIWGQSMGGHLVLRAFKNETRPVAGIDVAGPPSMNVYPFMSADTQERIRDLFGFSTFEETWDYCQEHGDAIRPASNIPAPCLIVHGSRDPLVSDEVISKLMESMGKNGDLLAFNDGNHGVFNWDFLMTDSMADWIVKKIK